MLPSRRGAWPARRSSTAIGLICLVGGEPDAKLVALDKLTGKEIWRALSSDTEPGYNQPMIIDAGGVRQLILFHPEGFSSLDPSTGKVYWEIEHRVQMGIVVATPVRAAATCSSLRSTAVRGCSARRAQARATACCGAVRASRMPG